MAVARYDAVADFYANGFYSTNDSVSLASWSCWDRWLACTSWTWRADTGA